MWPKTCSIIIKIDIKKLLSITKTHNLSGLLCFTSNEYVELRKVKKNALS